MVRHVVELLPFTDIPRTIEFADAHPSASVVGVDLRSVVCIEPDVDV